MENGDIPDENIHASSELFIGSLSFPATKARLNAGGAGHCWAPENSIPGEWIQADIGYQTYVTGVVTQGDGGHYKHDWVTSFTVSTFLTTSSDEEINILDEDGNAKVSKIGIV